MHPEHVPEHRDVEGERIVLRFPQPHVKRFIGIRANPRLIRWTTIVFEGDVEWEPYGQVVVHESIPNVIATTKFTQIITELLMIAVGPVAAHDDV